MVLGSEKIHYVNTITRGAVPNLPSWSVVELKALIGSHGARPVYAGELPSQAARWSLATIHTHELLVDGAIEKSREKATMALACDPMTTNLKEPVQLLDALIEDHGDRLADFKKTDS